MKRYHILIILHNFRKLKEKKEEEEEEEEEKERRKVSSKHRSNSHQSSPKVCIIKIFLRETQRWDDIGPCLN